MDNQNLKHSQTIDSESYMKKLVAQKYEDIIKHKEKFEDDIFPPDDSSLYSGKTEFYKTSGREVPEWIKHVYYIKFRTNLITRLLLLII